VPMLLWPDAACFACEVEGGQIQGGLGQQRVKVIRVGLSWLHKRVTTTFGCADVASVPASSKMLGRNAFDALTIEIQK